MPQLLVDFVTESNRIEGIIRKPSDDELEAHLTLLNLSDLNVDDIEQFVSAVQPRAILRRTENLNVRVGSYIAPRGGAAIEQELWNILADTLDGHPYAVHHRYETLHPFTDGNGRSGRAIWLWMMDKHGEVDRALHLGFLHNWYYQSLAAGRG